jgi:hypothetical protein
VQSNGTRRTASSGTETTPSSSELYPWTRISPSFRGIRST